VNVIVTYSECQGDICRTDHKAKDNQNSGESCDKIKVALGVICDAMCAAIFVMSAAIFVMSGAIFVKVMLK
jgi:hypothetical protein